MSAAFDTVDHPTLLQRLRDRFGMCDSVVSWFRSYFENRTTRVSIKNASSHKHILNYSLPQGSIIGPQCFILYISPIGDIIRQIRHHNISFHCYADDIQLYAAFDHKIPGECERTMDRITNCISELNMWMLQNKLQLNQEKTEFFVIAGPRVLNLVSDLQLKLDGKTIKPSISVKNLGVTFDGLMNMSIHISTLCKTINFQIRNLWRIRRFISQEACHHALEHLSSRYANSLLFGALQADLKRLQRVQNKAARLVFACGRDRCSADLLNSLHWLQVKDRIHFKILLYVYKCLMHVAPPYLCDLLTLLSDTVTHENRPRLRSSSDTTRLLVPRSNKRAGDHSFAVASPRLWNELPIQLREAVSVPAFKRLLKTHLY